MKIEVLGTRCDKCAELLRLVESAVAEVGVEAEIVEIEDLENVMNLEVEGPPVLVVDGEVKSSGRIPRASRIVSWIAEAASRQATADAGDGVPVHPGEDVAARIRALLEKPRVLGVVGMSPKPHRASNYVSRYLREHGFTTIPVNPMVSEVDGLTCYPDLLSLPETPKVDIVVLFVAPNRTLPVVEQAARMGVEAVWFQPGAEHPPAEQRARELGLVVVSGTCMKVEHQLLAAGMGRR